jgi:hypothetical protein
LFLKINENHSNIKKNLESKEPIIRGSGHLYSAAFPGKVSAAYGRPGVIFEFILPEYIKRKRSFKKLKIKGFPD